MPTYDFVCGACKNVFEIRRPMSASGPATCPKCHSKKTKQVMLEFPTMFTRNIDHPDSPLDDHPKAKQMRAQADAVIRKTLGDMGHTL